jgi:hypothetical protein
MMYVPELVIRLARYFCILAVFTVAMDAGLRYWVPSISQRICKKAMTSFNTLWNDYHIKDDYQRSDTSLSMKRADIYQGIRKCLIVSAEEETFVSVSIPVGRAGCKH